MVTPHRNPLAELAAVLGAFARVLSNPKVQDTFTSFTSAIEDAMAIEPELTQASNGKALTHG